MAPELAFLVSVAAGVSSRLIADWIIDRFRGRTTQPTIIRRIVDLDDTGLVRRVVDEEVVQESRE